MQGQTNRIVIKCLLRGVGKYIYFWIIRGIIDTFVEITVNDLIVKANLKYW